MSVTFNCLKTFVFSWNKTVRYFKCHVVYLSRTVCKVGLNDRDNAIVVRSRSDSESVGFGLYHTTLFLLQDETGMLFQTKYCTSLSNIRLHVVFVSCSSVKHTYWIIHSTETRRSRKYLSCCGLKPIRLLNCYIKQYHTHNHAVVLDVISLKSRRPKIRIHNQSRY